VWAVDKKSSATRLNYGRKVRMNLKKLASIFLVLLVLGIVAVAAYEQCIFIDGVSIGKQNFDVILENSNDKPTSVVYQVTFEDTTKTPPQQQTVAAKSTKKVSYNKRIQDVSPCW
jgi:hypothetical protein